jgi:hypothetical protein
MREVRIQFIGGSTTYSYHRGASNRFAGVDVLQPLTHGISVRVISWLGDGTLSVLILMKILWYDHICISK